MNMKPLTREEKLERQRVRQKKYYETHKAKELERVKQYLALHPEKAKESSKKYYEANKEKVLKSKKVYREKNKDAIKEKNKKQSKIRYEQAPQIQCECGGTYVDMSSKRERHFKTLMHKRFIC